MKRNEVARLLRYEPETGRLIWLVGKNVGGRGVCNDRIGTEAGTMRPDGYRLVNLGGVPRLTHRIAWLLQTGESPICVDHRNGDPSDNRWTNLRATSKAGNVQNQRHASAASSTGLLGVFRSAPGCLKPYRAQIVTAGKARHLGTFDTPGEAHQAYLEAKRVEHSTCTI